MRRWVSASVMPTMSLVDSMIPASRAFCSWAATSAVTSSMEPMMPVMAPFVVAGGARPGC